MGNFVAIFVVFVLCVKNDDTAESEFLCSSNLHFYLNIKTMKRKNSSYFCTLIDKTKSLETGKKNDIYILWEIQYNTIPTKRDPLVFGYF